MARGRAALRTSNSSRLSQAAINSSTSASKQKIFKTLQSDNTVKNVSRAMKIIKSDIDLADLDGCKTFAVALGMLAEVQEKLIKKEGRLLIKLLRDYIIDLVLTDSIKEFKAYPPLNAEYVKRQKPGMGAYSFFHLTSELVTRGLTFTFIAENNSVDVRPTAGIHQSSELEYETLFSLLEYGTTRIPARPFFSVIDKYLSDMFERLKIAYGWVEI